jgi:pyridoxine 5-phosphate synthase
MTLLSVNVNKVAVLRNSRGGRLPDVVAMAEAAIAAGCGGITVHPRPDQRHIRVDDVHALAASIGSRVEFNIEGNPFAPARGDYPGLLSLVEAARPTQVTLVPDGDGQITSDHGFDLVRDFARLQAPVAALRDMGCRVSLFVDAGCDGLDRVSRLGAQRIEIYTGPYAVAAAAGNAGAALASCAETAARAQALGIGVNAGHDLSQDNLGPFLAGVADVREVSIGHALFGEALYQGVAATVGSYLRIIAGVARGARADV